MQNKPDSHCEISFSSSYGKKLQAVTSVAASVDGNENDIADGGNESHASIESETEKEIVESEIEEDTEESDSSESEENVASVSATNGRKPQAKRKKAIFFGIILFMGIHKLPNPRLYREHFTHAPTTSTTTTRTRIDEIRSIMHFNDNVIALTPTSPNHKKFPNH